MVHAIFYGLLVIVLLVTNMLHLNLERKQLNAIKWWREKAVQYECELNALKEKQSKRKTIKK